MVTGEAGVLSPQALQLPEVDSTLSGANYTIGISGAKIMFWTGTAWEVVTSA